MYYVMSEPHGNAEAYFDMKERIKFGPRDELYILGDVLGGDPSHPEQCLRILDDIMQNDNTHLILGDFEYAYAQYYYSRSNKMKYKEYKQMVSELYGGPEFIEYMDTLSKTEKNKYVNYLFDRDVSKLIILGQRPFYLVHGAPAVCKGGPESNMVEWQKRVVQEPLDLKRDYKTAILSDNAARRGRPFDMDKWIIIAGHKSTASFEKNKSIFHEHAQAIFNNNRFLIHCSCYENGTCIANTLCCLAIDEEGENIRIHYRHEK